MGLFTGSETDTPNQETAVEELTDISASDELDFTNDGIPGHVVIAKVVSAERVPRDDGNVLFKIGFSVLNSTHISSGMSILSTFWSKHTNPTAQRIGRGQFKTLIQSALSRTAITDVSELEGTHVTAWAKDKDGFPVLGNWKTVSEDNLNEALAASGLGDLT